MRHAEIIFGIAGQSISFHAPEGRPSAAETPKVYALDASDDDPAEDATTGAAAIDAVDTTLAAAAAAGDSELELADATGVAKGRTYLLGELETVEVLAITGTTATLRRPLLGDHASGAAFASTRISVAIADAWAADTDNLTDCGYRVRWVYTVAGAQTVAASYLHLVRYPLKHLVTAAHVDDRIPGFLDRLPPDHRLDQGARLIAEALQAVRFDALGDGQVLRRLRETEVIRELVIYRANLCAVEAQIMAGGGRPEELEEARKAYRLRYDQLVREPKVPVDVAGDGAAAPAKRMPLWRR